MADKRIMFCCEECADNHPEGCGYFDRKDLRVMPNGRWLCDGCFTDCDAYDYGFRERDEDGGIVKPDWADLPVPLAVVRADLVEPLVIELRNARLQIQYLNERFGQTGSSNCTLNRIDAALQAYEAAQ